MVLQMVRKVAGLMVNEDFSGMMKVCFILLLGVFLIGFGSAATATYYFNSYDAGGEEWETTPANMVDGTETTYASTNNNVEIQLLNANNATGTNLGTITSVEIRAYGYYSDLTDQVRLRPVFVAGDGDNHDGAVPSSAGWGTLFDITADTNAPGTWTWADVQNMNMDVEHYRSGGPSITYVGEVEIQVTYTPNVAPDIVLNAPENDSTISVDYALLNTTVTDSDGDNMTVWFYGNGSFLDAQTDVLNSSTVTYNWTALIDGLYNWSVVAWDGIVNVTSEIYHFVVDATAPLVDIIYPLGDVIDEDGDVAITLNISDLSPIDTIIANVTSPNGTSYILTDFSTGLVSDDFSSDTEGINWVHAEIVAGSQTCSADIDETVPGKMFIESDGAGGPTTTQCAFNSLRKVDGNYDLNVTFNLTYMEADTFFTLRSSPTDALQGNGVRVWAFAVKEGADVVYYLGYNNGTSSIEQPITVNETYGKFRIKRFNMSNNGTPVFNLYYMNMTDETWINIYENISLPGSARTQTIQLKPGSEGDNYGKMNMTIDDFQISSDNYTFAIFNQTAFSGTYNVSIFVNDSLGNINNTETTFFNVLAINDPPAFSALHTPDPNDIISGIINITWVAVTDDEDHNVQFNITLLNSNGSYNTTIVSNYGNINSTYYEWNTTNHSDGLYGLRIKVFENETAENLSDEYTLSGNFTIDNSAPLVDIIYPLGQTINRDDDVAISLDITELTLDTIEANVTSPNGSSYLVTDFGFGLSSDNFDTNSLGTKWEFRNDSIDPNQACSADINSSVADKAYIEITGTSGGTRTSCGLVGLKKLDGDFDINVSFNITDFGEDGYFILRSRNERDLGSFGPRVLAFIFKDGGEIYYYFGYYNGTGFKGSGYTPTEDTFGKLRIKKYNSTGIPRFEAYYWNNTGSDWINTMNVSVNTSSRTQFAQVYLESESGAIRATADDFFKSGDDYRFSIFNQTSQEGYYNVSVFVNDSFGRVNNTENTTFLILRAENTAPEFLALIFPKEGHFTRGVVNITWDKASDTDGDSVRWNVTLLNDDNSFNATLATDYGDIDTILYEWNTSNHADGTYRMKVDVYENDTFEMLSHTSTGGIFTIDNTNPLVAINSPVDTFNTSLTSVNFNWTATDNLDTILNCNLTIDGVVNVSGIASANATATNYSVSGFANGAHTWNVSCADNSGNVNTSETRDFTIDTTAPSLTVISVAGDTDPSYYDTNGTDGVTDIIVDGGEVNMICKWGSTDTTYNFTDVPCVTSGTTANCSITSLAEGYHTKYISCRDQYGNENDATNNLDVSFTLDYTAPTTTDDSSSAFVAPNYTVTISEADNVAVPGTTNTSYCTSSSEGCNPTTFIDDAGTIIYTSSNRGVNYLRYYSIDYVGNTQTIVNKTININQLPVFTSAVDDDDDDTILGGTAVNVSSVSSDVDSGQEMTLYVCDSSSATSAGCGDGSYCSATSTSNMSCVFSSETDSAVHSWHAFIYDKLGEGAVANFSGSYTTDSAGPVITLVSPINNPTITQDSVTLIISVDESLSSAWYSLDGGTTNVTMTNISQTVYTYTNSSIADGTYNMTFWVNDSYGNNAVLGGNWFTIDTAEADTTAPTVSVWSPVDNSYDTDGNVLLNITMNEDIVWAAWSNDSGATLNIMGNTSLTSWNATVTFVEGQHDIIFYANDTSDNQGGASVTVYVDLNNPAVSNFSCTDVNDSEDVVCTIVGTDAIGLQNYKVGYNASGAWVNSSLIGLTGTSNSTPFTILSGNHSPAGFSAQLYLYDLAGRVNDSSTDAIVISDDTLPIINNFTYSPNTSDGLDPGVRVYVNATITEDYNISVVYLTYKNSSATSWTYQQMDNNSVLVSNGASTIVYNASFLPQTENWTFQINVTDFAGNQNVSVNTTIEVANDISENIITTIPVISSFTTAQATSNKSLGRLIMNNTGDGSLWFNVSLTSTDAGVESRLSVNYTGNLTENYTAASFSDVNITIDVNLTDLDSGLYAYNITIVSDVGTTVYERNLNIQDTLAPLLSVSIDTYSSVVTRGQTGLSLIASVTNLGTSDATGVYLNWTLPSGFSLVTGNLNGNLGNLGVGVIGTNTITIDVGSSISESTLNLFAAASSTNTDSDNDTKVVTISNPIIITETITTPGGGGGGGGRAGVGEILIYDKEIEVIRGEDIEFEIEVSNKLRGSVLRGLKIVLVGFPEQYLSIAPIEPSELEYGQTGVFVVVLEAPIYKSYEEHDLIATITGTRFKDGGSGVSYREIQNIKLIVQAIAEEEGRISLSEAEAALQLMRDAGFNVKEAERLLEEAKIKLESNRNKQAKDLADDIVVLSERAFEADALIHRIMAVLTNPRASRLLLSRGITGFSVSDYRVNGYFEDHPSVELIDLALVAFERGDYALAKKRADSARTTILFTVKNNMVLFFFLYWPFIVVGALLLLVAAVFGFRKYRKSAVSRKIRRLNNKEENIRKLIMTSQESYFVGKISSTEYHRVLNHHHKKLSGIKKVRIGLRNQRIKMLKSRKILTELKLENMQIEGEIKKLQTLYYKAHKVSEQEYKLQFEILNGRLAEIESERTTLSLDRSKKLIKEKRGSTKKVVKKSRKISKKGWVSMFGFVGEHRARKLAEEEKRFKGIIDEMLGGINDI